MDHPSIIWISIQILAGLIALVGGGELLVRGASLLALGMRISPLVIGLTVVAFGTSAPELGVSLQAAMSGASDVAVGNVVGSNICNVLLILGASALVAPLLVSSQLIRLDVPLMVFATLLLWAFCLDGSIARWEGGVLFTSLVIYIVFSLRQSRKESQKIVDEFAAELPKPSGWSSRVFVQIGLIVAGLILLGLGAKWLVGGAVSVAHIFGISELIIGLTIVAIGTSLPELVTSAVASYRGERDIAVGNVVGSNLFNILCVLGISSIVSPAGVPVTAAALAFDVPVMVAVSLVCLPIFFTGNSITRFEGGMLLFYYTCYLTLLVLAETHPEWNQRFAMILATVVIPFTLLTIGYSVYSSWKAMSAKRDVATSD
ncbi:MAG: calcium/sodium antiporter [Pirellulaceae bacterium]